MDMRHDNSLRSNPVYQARIAEEETKLRWLITRQPRSRELSYYLIFLLTANERYASAIEECRRVLDIRRLLSSRHFDRDRRGHRITRHAG